MTVIYRFNSAALDEVIQFFEGELRLSVDYAISKEVPASGMGRLSYAKIEVEDMDALLAVIGERGQRSYWSTMPGTIVDPPEPRTLDIKAIIDKISVDRDLSSDKVRAGYVDEVFQAEGRLGTYLESLNALFDYVNRELPKQDKVHLNVEEFGDISDLTCLEVNLVRTLVRGNDYTTKPSTTESHTIAATALEFDENELHEPNEDIRKIGLILNQISNAYNSVEARYLKSLK